MLKAIGGTLAGLVLAAFGAYFLFRPKARRRADWTNINERASSTWKTVSDYGKNLVHTEKSESTPETNIETVVA